MPLSFSVAVITRNGARTLPRLFASLRKFQEREGEIILVDTGSADGAPDVARSFGAKVTEVGERFIQTIDSELAATINGRFVAEGEAGIVESGSRLFNFSAARNFAAELASNDWVCWADDDEAFTVLDLDKIEAAIADPALDHVEYDFVFAWDRPPAEIEPGVYDDRTGVPGMAFTQSKMYRRSRMYWTGAVHELVTPKPMTSRVGEGPNRIYLDPSIFHLGHWQEAKKGHRSNYLPGLGWDAWQKLTEDVAGAKDRQWHYLGREMLWTGRPRSAIKVLKEHIEMNGWPAERAQSMIFIGDASLQIGDKDSAMEWYSRAYHADTSRREALLRMAHYYRGKDHQASAAYAAASLEIAYHPFYANNMGDYREIPHKLLYFAKGWLGDIPAAQHHILRALDYSPFDPEATRDLKFYFDYDVSQAPEGWMVGSELIWLHDHAKGRQRVAEVGSWKGRSTHALATGAGKTGGIVWAIDHFRGSSDEQDLTHGADPDSIYRQFLSNTKDLKNVFVRRADSLEAAKDFPNGYFDLLFIDATHLYDPVKADILAWAPKCKGLLCGHDFSDTWPEVRKAVRDVLGEPDGVHCSIWHKQMRPPAVNPLLLYMTQCIRHDKPVSLVKRGDGEEACMSGVPGGNCDGHPYSVPLAGKLRLAFHQLEAMAEDRRDGRTRVNVVPFEDQNFYNILLNRNDVSLDSVKAFWGAVRESKKPKVFVGPGRLKPAANMLNAEFVEIPAINAFARYEEIRRVLLHRDLKPGPIFVFCASMPAKAWIAELLGVESEISCIDAGSAFDPIFVGATRTGQLPMDLLVYEYREWLEA